jgi:hypothetical protein
MTTRLNEDLETLQAFLKAPDIAMDCAVEWRSMHVRIKTEKIVGLDAIRAKIASPGLGDAWLTLTDRVLWRDWQGTWHSATPGAVPDPLAAMPLAGEFRLNDRSAASFRHIHGERWSITTVDEVEATATDAQPALARTHVTIATVRGLRIRHRVYWCLDPEDGEYQPAGSRFDCFEIKRD